MIENIGNCSSIIDWNSVIRDCANTEPAFVGPSHKRGDNLPGLDEILDLWEKHGYQTLQNGGNVGWDMFLPGQQFDSSVVDQFNNYFELECENFWISRVHPGRFAALHWDVHDDEEIIGDRPRYHCHIGAPAFGHVFLVDEQCFYNQPQGTTYKWESRKLWHAGNNCGITPKYILNVW